MRPTLLRKVQLAALLAATWLILGGLHSAWHPRLLVEAPRPPREPGVFAPPSLRLSAASRWFGICRVGVGLALVGGVWWTFRARPEGR